MARRPTATQDEEDNLVSLKDVRFRFRWIERDIKDISDTVRNHTHQLERLNRNVLVMGIVIITLGVGSKVLSEPLLDIVKKVVGLG